MCKFSKCFWKLSSVGFTRCRLRGSFRWEGFTAAVLPGEPSKSGEKQLPQPKGNPPKRRSPVGVFGSKAPRNPETPGMGAQECWGASSEQAQVGGQASGVLHMEAGSGGVRGGRRDCALHSQDAESETKRNCPPRSALSRKMCRAHPAASPLGSSSSLPSSSLPLTRSLPAVAPCRPPTWPRQWASRAAGYLGDQSSWRLLWDLPMLSMAWLHSPPKSGQRVRIWEHFGAS